MSMSMMRLLLPIPTLLATVGTATVAASSGKIQNMGRNSAGSEETVEKIVEYLESTKPAMDAGVSREYIRKNAEYALQARNSNSWAKAVPWVREIMGNHNINGISFCNN
jgi:hypothetical protein